VTQFGGRGHNLEGNESVPFRGTIGGIRAVWFGGTAAAGWQFELRVSLVLGWVERKLIHFVRSRRRADGVVSFVHGQWCA
jgi:hypothetical protein